MRKIHTLLQGVSKKTKGKGKKVKTAQTDSDSDGSLMSMTQQVTSGEEEEREESPFIEPEVGLHQATEETQAPPPVTDSEIPPDSPTFITTRLEVTLETVMEEICGIKLASATNISQYRILMIGPVGSGKSSYYNTINSVFRGRISQRAVCGTALHSTTTTYKPYQVRTKTGSLLQFRLCDTRGLEETQGIDLLECSFLLDGHIPELYKFNPSSQLTVGSPEFVLKPKMSDKFHCVMFVLDASADMSETLITKLNSFREKMTQREIPQVILLTKIDKISKAVKERVPNVFTCVEVEKKVEYVSKLLGLPRNHILPMKNYENEMQLDDNISVLALLALRQVLYFAEDYMENMLMQNEIGSDALDKIQSTTEDEVCESDTA